MGRPTRRGTARFVALPLIPLGLPWSLPAATDPYRFDGAGTALRYLALIGPAWLNLALHGALFARFRTRRTRST